MPAFCAAFGSFHPKSSVMYFVRVLTTVRVLPFFLTLTLIRSSTLTVSTFGVRSYSDQRYWSMQTSGSGHASSTSTAGLAAFCTGSIGLVAANSTGDVAGCGIGGDSDNTALPLAISATETLCSPSAVARGASTCPARTSPDVARLTSIGAPVLSMPSDPRPASPAPTQPARASVPHNAANTANRRGHFTPVPLSSFSAKQWQTSKFSRRLQTLQGS